MKSLGRLALLIGLTSLISVLAVLMEVLIDKLTVQTRDLQHLLKHSMGNVGTMMIIFSLAGYMIRKRWKSFPGALKDWLNIHQWFATMGAALVAVHSGAHFGAAVPIVAFLFMMICLVSGFVGRYVYSRAMKDVVSRRTMLDQTGVPRDVVQEMLALDVAAAKSLSKWRSVHRPFSFILGALMLLHVFSGLYYGG